jgi:hypothetical protein
MTYEQNLGAVPTEVAPNQTAETQAPVEPASQPTPTVVDVEIEKPYKFRRLGAQDIFLMTPILSAIGINQLVEALPKNAIHDAIIKRQNEGGENASLSEDEIASVGLSAVGGLLQILLANIDKCENQIFKLLASTSNLKEDELRRLDFDIFVGMIVDFVKKDEFGNFIKAVSKFMS